MLFINNACINMYIWQKSSIEDTIIVTLRCAREDFDGQLSGQKACLSPSTQGRDICRNKKKERAKKERVKKERVKKHQRKRRTESGNAREEDHAIQQPDMQAVTKRRAKQAGFIFIKKEKQFLSLSNLSRTNTHKHTHTNKHTQTLSSISFAF